jgi:hypothetical protein
MSYGSIGGGTLLSKRMTAEEMTEEMADRKAEIRYLREKAQQFRELARTHQTEISPKLKEIARELDDRADTLEKNQD